MIPLEQSLAIQAWLAESVDRAADRLIDEHAVDTEMTVLETRCGRLSELAAEGFLSEGERIAGVMRAYRGQLEGAALLAMDPEEALAWSLADRDGRSPVETYVDLGGRVLQAVAEVAAESLGVEAQLSAARLEESTAADCLVATHAPPDVMMLSSRVEIRVSGQWLAAELHLLLPPKVLSQLLRSLSVGIH